MTMGKPRFSSPIRLAAGTRQFSKCSVAVSEAHQPIFFSSVREKPGVSRSISSSDTPPAPRSAGLVRTATE
jgi:hypothetical protein